MSRVRGAEVVLILLSVAFLVGMAANNHIFGDDFEIWPSEHPPPPDHSVAIVVAACGTIGAPVIGIMVALSIQRTLIASIAGALLVIGILVTSFTLSLEPSTGHSNPKPTWPDRTCAAYSGGDNDCPGG